MAKNVFIDINRNPLNLELVLSFICPITQKAYVLVDNKNKVFSPLSKYENLDMLEINTHTGNNIILKQIEASEWDVVQDFFYKNICGRVKTDTIY